MSLVQQWILPLEQAVLGSLKQYAAQTGLCLVIVTHRPAVVDIVERLIVIDHAEIVADGPKSIVLKMLEPVPTTPTKAQEAHITAPVIEQSTEQTTTAD